VLVYKSVPPEGTMYHLKTPLRVEVAPRVTVPVPHLFALMPVTDVDTTDAVTCDLGLVHVPLEYSTK
jgi:hypothetical protein